MKQETNLSNSAMWASAFIVTALIIFTAGTHTPRAAADSVITDEGFTLLTTSSGQGSDFLYIIDNQSSMLMVYDIPDPQNRKFIRPVTTWSLPALFNSVRN